MTQPSSGIYHEALALSVLASSQTLYPRPKRQEISSIDSKWLYIHGPSKSLPASLTTSSVNGSHIQRPFFLRSDLEKLYARVFSEAEGSSDMNLASKDSHDLYRTFMILAIGSVISYRNGATLHHPYGYYVSAMKYLDDSFLARGLESIQDLLLIGRFAIYYHIGISTRSMSIISSNLQASYFQEPQSGKLLDYA